MGQIIVGDLRTGRRWKNVPFTKYRWEQRKNQPETIQAEFTLADAEVRALDLRNIATEGKAFLGIVETDDVFPAAGPLLPAHSYDRDTRKVTLSAQGMGGWFQGLPIAPPLAGTIPVEQFVVPDPEDPTGTIPNPALTTAFDGYSLGSIVRGLLAQWMSWPGANLPIVLPPFVAGDHERTGWDAVDFKDLWDAIADITDLEDGIDVAFPARWNQARTGVEWDLRTGTAAQPRFRATTVHRWDLSVEQPNTRGLKATAGPGVLASTAFYTGGRSTDVALVERATDTHLTDLGFPLRITVDQSHSTVSRRTTLRGYANEAVRLGRHLPRFITFQTRKDAAPYFGQYNLGDACELIIRNDPWLPDGDYQQEIVALGGDHTPWVTVTTEEIPSA